MSFLLERRLSSCGGVTGRILNWFVAAVAILDLKRSEEIEKTGKIRETPLYKGLVFMRGLFHHRCASGGGKF